MRILVVDDDETLLDAMARAITAAGEEAVPCRLFDEARRALEHQRFDALLTDVRLGPSNGLQLAIVARQLYPNMPVIVFSGFDDPVLRAEAERIGVPYLVKPVSPQEILARIRGGA